jgi:hypothetical protein
LEFTEISQEGSDVFGGVFIGAVQTDERIEHKEGGSDRGEGFAQSLPVPGQIEQQARSGDDIKRQRVQGDVGGCTDPCDPIADDAECIFGGKEQDRAGAAHGELPQAGGAGGDADGDVQGQEALAALGFAAKDADGLLGPKPFDEPTGLFGVFSQIAGPLDR